MKFAVILRLNRFPTNSDSVRLFCLDFFPRKIRKILVFFVVRISFIYLRIISTRSFVAFDRCLVNFSSKWVKASWENIEQIKWVKLGKQRQKYLAVKL